MMFCVNISPFVRVPKVSSLSHCINICGISYNQRELTLLPNTPSRVHCRRCPWLQIHNRRQLVCYLLLFVAGGINSLFTPSNGIQGCSRKPRRHVEHSRLICGGREDILPLCSQLNTTTIVSYMIPWTWHEKLNLRSVTIEERDRCLGHGS